MGEKDFLKKLQSLKTIQPGLSWKERNREILASQIYSNIQKKYNIKILALPKNFFHFISQPAWAVIFICLAVFGGSFISVKVAQTTMPGDSMFIARVISEKAQLAITFNEEAKAKLGLKFANNHAKEISKILSNTDLTSEKNIAKAEKLTIDFKKEINSVKSKLKEINQNQNSELGTNQEAGSENSEVFSANLKKEDNGMQVSEVEIKESEIDNQTTEVKENIETGLNTSLEAGEEISTTTNDSSVKINESLEEAHRILEDAEKLFNEKDYNGTVNQLEKVDALVEGTSQAGEVKGVSEGENLDNITGDLSSDEATSTKE
ncbi:MAG: hypothetical protein ABH830_02335 [Patescibacteria group bacterium]